MPEYPSDLKYSASHEWVKTDGDVATIGITDHAQDELGDVVYVSLPEAGRKVESEEAFGTVESVKAVSDLIAPVTGEVLEVNEELADAPELINQDPYSGGWLLRVRMEKPAELDGLMSAEQYEASL